MAVGAIAGVFPIGSTGDEFVVAEWHPDPRVIQQELFKLANQIDDWSVPLAKSKAAFIESTRIHFETESDPYGRAWTPLSELYLKEKLAAGFTGNILHREGELEKAATSEGAWIVEEHDIIFNVDALPFYGPYHQSGTLDSERQAEIHDIRLINKATRAYNASKSDSDPEKVLINTSTQGVGSGRGLPQRMFIGADEFTILEIEDIFVKWLEENVDSSAFGKGFAGDTSNVTLYGSNVQGVFPIIGYESWGQPRLSTGKFGKYK